MFTWVEDLIAKTAGKQVAGKLQLTEGTVDTKKWWQSKTIWSDVVTILVAIVAMVDKDFGLALATNHWFQLGLTFLGAVGIYGRATSDTTIQG